MTCSLILSENHQDGSAITENSFGFLLNNQKTQGIGEDVHSNGQQYITGSIQE